MLSAPYLQIGRYLETHCGLRVDQQNAAAFAKGLDLAARAEGVDISRLCEMLRGGPIGDLFQRVIRNVTVGETYFFRHPEHFEFVRDVVVPELQVSWSGSNTEPRYVRAWSAGCASGEEAYSLAVTLRDALGAQAPWEIRVLGTDINSGSLAIAREARYPARFLRGKDAVPPGYLIYHADGCVEMAASVRALVRFAYLNLCDECYPSLLTGTTGMDVIFCRNVLLYLSAAASKVILARLALSLRPGGYLVLCSLDVSHEQIPSLLEPVRIASGMGVYQRRALPVGEVVRSRPRLQHKLDEIGAPQCAPVEVSPSPDAGERSVAAAAGGSEDIVAAAAAAAAAGDLVGAMALMDDAIKRERSPVHLHMLALLLAEAGDAEASERLLAEAVTLDKDYVQGLLALGLFYRARDDDDDGYRANAYLGRVATLIGEYRESYVLPGPEGLSVSWVRKLVRSAVFK